MSTTDARVVVERPELFSLANHRGEDGRPRVLIFVGGTTHWEWALPDSAFRRAVIDPAGIPVAARFEWWSGALWSPRDDWKRGGQEQLAPVLQQIEPGIEVEVLSHSHGLQVSAWAIAAAGVPIRSWVSVAGPVRSEMEPVYASAMAHCDRFTQIQAKEWDRTQWGGQWFGRFFTQRRTFTDDPPRVVTRSVKGIGHSGLLYDEKCFPLWQSEALTPLLAEAA